MDPEHGPNGNVYLVSAARTPIGKFGGALASVPATELGAVAIRAAVERAGLPFDAPVDEVFMGQVLQAGAGQAPARQALLRAGLADTTPATTINRVCGSGLKSIMLAASAIRAGDGDLFVAGGMESMNGAPYLLRKARFGYRLGPATMDDSAVADGLWCAVEDCHMGTHAERVAIRDHVSREDQDAFALQSHRRAVAAQDEGRFDAELVPVPVRDARGRETLVAADEGPRRDTSLEALAKLPPVFDLPAGEDRGDATLGHRDGRQRPGHHRRCRGGRGRQRAGGRAPRAAAPRPGRRLRPGRGRAEVAVPRPDRGRAGAGAQDGARAPPTTTSSRSTRRSPRRRSRTAASSGSTGTRST